jgi:AcrR family transcriptional regulator
MNSYAIATVNEGIFFNAPRVLPRGRHKLPRDQVIAVQRERVMTALVELMAARGYHGFAVGEVATRASVSRGAFYDCFDSKDACAFAAYERFIGVLLERIAERTAPSTDWNSFITGLVDGYLATLSQDVVVARAFQVEMDAIGPEARNRRRAALLLFADHIRAQHERLRASDPTLQPMSSEAYLGAVYAARQVASDALDTESQPDLMALAGGLVPWLTQSFRTPPAAHRSLRAAPPRAG